MGFVESVVGELLDVLPDGFRQIVRDVVGLEASFDEFIVLRLHVLDFLFADRAAEDVRLSEREPGEHLHDLHDLLLVEHDSVGLLEILLHQRMVVFDGHGSELAPDEERDELHRAGAVDRQKRDDLLDALHAELAAEILHAAGL